MREINLKKLLKKMADPITADTIPDGIITKAKLASDVVDLIYPVGAVYLSTAQTSPAALFGGTWQRIEDRFLLAAGSDYAAGDTGGSARQHLMPENLPSHSHEYSKAGTETERTTLSAAQLPAHSHYYQKSDSVTGSTRLTVNQIPAHTHDVVVKNTSGTSVAIATASSASGLGKSGYTTETGGGQGHTHTVGTHEASTENEGSGIGHAHSITSASSQTGATGGGVSFSNMPPYLAVYVWRRTA